MCNAGSQCAQGDRSSTARTNDASHLTLQLQSPLRQLLAMQARGKIRRTLKRLASPRRAIPTLLVAILMGLYVVKVYIAVTGYQSPTKLPIEGLAPVGMLYVLLLKLLGVCIDRKKSGAGYRKEETHRLLGGPFPIEQVRLFRVTGHAVSIFFTSLFAAVFFAFHVKSFAAAIAGAYMAMLFTYLVYTLIAVVAYQVSETTYRRLRVMGCGLVGAMVAWILYRVNGRGVSNLQFLQALGEEAIGFSTMPVIAQLMTPYSVFTKVIVAESFSSWVLWMLPSMLLNYTALQLLLYAESYLDRRQEQRDRAEFLKMEGTHKLPFQDVARDSVSLSSVPWWGGVGPIFWRQLKGVLRLKSGLCWLLFPLAAVIMSGAYLAYDVEAGAFQTVAVVVVMTSVFLPGLLPFDFRGDLHGLPALKMMPIRPTAVVLGQLLVPVIVLTAFQLLSLSTILLHDPTQWMLIVWTVLFLIPTNIVILALENLIFLLYPYKIAEFDMQATVRRVVMLMVKFCVIFFAVLLTIAAALGVVGLKMALDGMGLGSALGSIWQPMLILVELIALVSVAWSVVWVTSWTYRRFDLSEDLPA